MLEPLHNPQCHARHVGDAWAMEPRYLTQAVAAIRAGTWPARQPVAFEDVEDQVPNPKEPAAPPRTPYQLTAQGVAVIPVMGAIMKGWSKFATANSLQIRRDLRQAAADPSVRGILLHIDSPGGTTRGTQELADEVWAVGQQKPLHAHADDCCASAAYWVAAQAGRLSVNPMGRVGSIGTYAVIEDTSKAADMQGVKVHVVSTGPLKGADVDGIPISKELLAEVQEWVDAANAAFLAGVERGRGTRGLAGKALAEVADGRMLMSGAALKAGLVDAVESLEAAHSVLVAKIESTAAVARAGAARARIAQSRVG